MRSGPVLHGLAALHCCVESLEHGLAFTRLAVAGDASPGFMGILSVTKGPVQFPSAPPKVPPSVALTTA